jgi:hypothetical protein
MKGKKTVIACMLQQHHCKVHVTNVNDKQEWLLFPTAVAAECMLMFLWRVQASSVMLGMIGWQCV